MKVNKKFVYITITVVLVIIGIVLAMTFNHTEKKENITQSTTTTFEKINIPKIEAIDESKKECELNVKLETTNLYPRVQIESIRVEKNENN